MMEAIKFSQLTKRFLFAGLIILLSPILFAQKSNEPIKLKADSGEYDGIKQVATYSGNVEIEQANMKLNGDKVLVYFQDNEVIKVEAYGRPAKFAYKPDNEPTIHGQSNFMQYDVKNKKVSMKGNAKIKQGVNQTTASSLNYDLKKERVKSSQVQMIFQPKK